MPQRILFSAGLHVCVLVKLLTIACAVLLLLLLPFVCNRWFYSAKNSNREGGAFRDQSLLNSEQYDKTRHADTAYTKLSRVVYVDRNRAKHGLLTMFRVLRSIMLQTS